jgi:hypothetical protein
VYRIAQDPKDDADAVARLQVKGVDYWILEKHMWTSGRCVPVYSLNKVFENQQFVVYQIGR